MDEDIREYNNVNFTCYCCRKSIKGWKEYQHHVDNEHIKCEICGRGLKNEAAKFHHYNIHNVGGGKWNQRRSYIGGALANSEDKDTSKIQFQCEFCEEILPSISEWRNHRSKTHSMIFTPNSSDHLAPQPEDVLDLVMTRLTVKAQKSYAYLVKCPADFCGFYPAPIIAAHIQKDHPNSSLRYNCSICGDIFEGEYEVMDHKSKEHNGQTIAEDEVDEMSMYEEGGEEGEGEGDQGMIGEEGGGDVTIQETIDITSEVDISALRGVHESSAQTVQELDPTTVNSQQEVLSVIQDHQQPILVDPNVHGDSHQGEDEGRSTLVGVTGDGEVLTSTQPPPTNTTTVYLSQRRNNVVNLCGSDLNFGYQQQSPNTSDLKGTKRKLASDTGPDTASSNEDEYITFVEGEHYVEEKNDIQLNLTITRAPNNGRTARTSSKPALSSAPRVLYNKPKQQKVRTDLLTSGSSMLTVLPAHQQQQQLANSSVVASATTTAHQQQEPPRMIVVSGHGELTDGQGQTYIIQHEDGTHIQQIQANVITEATVVQETVGEEHHMIVGDEHHVTVGGADHHVTVGEADHVTVGGEHHVTVGDEHHVTIGGEHHHVTVGDEHHVTVGDEHHVTIGDEQHHVTVGGEEVASEQTILHVPAGEGQQPTFVIQSQEFQVTS